jgi:hypothetical protein
MKWFMRTGHVDCGNGNPKTPTLHNPIKQHAVQTSRYRASSDAFVARIKSTTAIGLTRSGLGKASQEFESHPFRHAQRATKVARSPKNSIEVNDEPI